MTGSLGARDRHVARSRTRPGARPPLRRLLLAAVLLAPAGACSIYNQEYVYDPGPVDVATLPPGNGDTEPVHTLITVVGVRRADGKTGLPASVEIRMRVENTSTLPVVFDPRSLTLFTAGLDRFADPIVFERDPLSLAPGRSAVVEACFPFPAGSGPNDYDLNGLNVRWALSIGGRTVTSSASFSRRPTGYYDRYPNRIGVGYQGYP